MRMLVYNQLAGNTSTGKIRNVIIESASLMGIKLDNDEVPLRSSIERMQLEFGIISDLQARNMYDVIFNSCCTAPFELNQSAIKPFGLRMESHLQKNRAR